MAGAESFLHYRYRNSTQSPAVFSNTNGLLEQVGSNVGSPWTSYLPANEQNLRQTNLVVEWEGDLYAVAVSATNQLAVFKHDSVTGDWAQDTTDLLNLPSASNRAVVNLGLHPVEIDGVPYLYFIYNELSTTMRNWTHVRKQSRFKGDGSWSAELLQALTDETADTETDVRGVCFDMLVDDNKLYTSFTRGGSLHGAGSRAGAIGNLTVFDFKTRIWSELPHAYASGYEVGPEGQGGMMGPMALAKFKGKVYQLAREGLSEESTGTFYGSNILIQSFTQGIVGGKVEQILIGDLDELQTTDPSNDGAQNWIEGRYCMFVDRSLDKMYAIAYIRGSGVQGGPKDSAAGRDEDGWACWQLDQDTNGDLINEGELSHIVLPVSVRAGISGRLGNPPQSLRWTSYDIVDASGATEIILELAGGGEEFDLVNTYRWKGPAQELEFLGQGGGGDLAVPLINAGGGEGIYSPRHPFDVVVGTDPSGGQDVGEVTLTTRVLGTGQPIDIRWFHAASSGDIPNLICTIKDTSSGVISGNVLTGIIADSGVEYSVTWEAATDGIPANSFFSIKSSAVIV